MSARQLGVVIPTYNRPAALLECLDHLQNQTCKDFEVVVVDDGSTDSTSKQMEIYLASTPLAMRYVLQSNSGPAKARNLGISLLHAPVCLMLGDDILASPTLVESHLRLHRKFPDVEIAALGWTKWSTSGQTITPFMRWLGEGPIQFAYKDLLEGAQADWKHFYTSNLSVKTELLRKFPFKEDFPYAAMEDIELAYRIKTQCGLEMKFIPEALADHLHPTTFRQACERMVRVGYSCRLFHDLWPEQQLPRPNWLKRAAIVTIAQSPKLTNLLVGAADLFTRALCPNPLMKAALACQYEIGYQSQRDTKGKLVRR